jgi:predicted ATP-dependent endonuclease of OLD family
MILVAGLFLRHYGVYKNINYIPLSDGENFTSLIGENGVGKSSILDALDKFFNHKDSKDWVINKQAQLEGGISTSDKTPFFSPLFLISKSASAELLSEELTTTLEIISNYFWASSKKAVLDDFYNHRDIIKSVHDEETYYLISIGKRHNEKDAFFLTFEPEIKKLFDDAKLDFKTESAKLLSWIIDNITYLYIPVETNVNSFTKLEAADMQILMDKNIHTEVSVAIDDKTVKAINKNLDNFIIEIEKNLPEYKYKSTGKRKNLTKLDIVQKTIEAYFSVKILHKKVGSSEVPIQHLSSGEKRRALVDLAYAYLVHGEERQKDVILAIDEPESSLHVSACFNQFENLKKIAQNNTQLIITTHWYGHLPILSSGKSILISKEGNEILKDSFNLSNYREQIAQERKELRQNAPPYSVQLKSYNDLTQSIIESLQNGYNWIICEGSSEKVYFEHYFSEEIEKQRLCILPCGGSAEVLRMARYIKTPLQDKNISITGKVLCLIDTDIEAKTFEQDNSLDNLLVKRLLNINNTIELVDINDIRKIPATEIEDALQPILYLQTLEYFEDPEVMKVLGESDFIESATNSADCMDLKISGKVTIKNFFLGQDIKYLFAKKYVELSELDPIGLYPDWVRQIKAEFAEVKPKALKRRKPVTSNP